ncbi:MAG: class I SAM-dependent methyltransferase [Anaerolineae bacterium]|nr:class I SAM-dependent methyltransferase [Anaerolineae bacterium]
MGPVRHATRRLGEWLIRMAGPEDAVEDSSATAQPTYQRFTRDPYKPETVDRFASSHYQAINQARLAHLEKLNLPLENKVVLDIGSGPGDMAQFFVQRGSRVICVDGRQDVIDRMAELYPDLEGHTRDVQVPGVLDEFGPVDIVFCYGLLYHVENPIQVIRNMAAVCTDMLLISTQICDSDLPVVHYAIEGNTASQALRGMGGRPSINLVVTALSMVGFEHVYRPSFLPDHPQFQFEHLNNLDWKRNRTALRAIFIASHSRLDNPHLISYF